MHRKIRNMILRNDDVWDDVLQGDPASGAVPLQGGVQIAGRAPRAHAEPGVLVLVQWCCWRSGADVDDFLVGGTAGAVALLRRVVLARAAV
eukprot:3765374-Pyramimonas_sp.AAC.1